MEVLITICLFAIFIIFVDFYRQACLNKQIKYNKKLKNNVDCRLTNDHLLNFIKKSVMFETGLLTCQFNYKTILLVYSPSFHKGTLRIYKKSVQLEEMKLSSSFHHYKNIFNTHPKQTLAILTSDNLDLLSSFKDSLHITIKKNLIKLKFPINDPFVDTELYSIIAQLMPRFLSSKPLNELIIENVLHDPSLKIKVENFFALINDYRKILSTIISVKIECPYLLTIFERQFQKNGFGREFNLLIEESLKYHEFDDDTSLSYSTGQDLVKSLQDKSRLETFLDMINTQIVNQPKKVLNEFIIEECQTNNETSNSFLLALLKHKNIQLKINSIHTLLSYFKNHIVTESIDWINQLVKANTQFLNLNLVVNTLIAFDDIRSIQVLKNIQKQFKWKLLPFGQEQDESGLQKRIASTIDELDRNSPLGGLSISDYKTQGSLSITDESIQGNLSITDSDIAED